MIHILNTSNAKTRDQALNIIIKQMTNSLLYIPLAYKLDGSGCSCCFSEYFYLICKVKNEYKILFYDSYIKHSKNCAIIRCTCNEPFIWNNINPEERKYEDFSSINETFTSINDDSWYNDFTYFIEQQQENKNIYEYNEDEDDASDKYEYEYIKTDITKKNYSFYFTEIQRLGDITKNRLKIN
jgi:hypothetical protein